MHVVEKKTKNITINGSLSNKINQSPPISIHKPLVEQSYFVHERNDLKDELILPQIVSVFENNWVHGSILCLEDQLSWHQSALPHTHTHTDGRRGKKTHEQSRTEGKVLRDEESSFQYLEERGRLRDDASDSDQRLQGKRNGLNLGEIHLLVVRQQSLQPLRLQTHGGRRGREGGLLAQLSREQCAR